MADHQPNISQKNHLQSTIHFQLQFTCTWSGPRQIDMLQVIHFNFTTFFWNIKQFLPIKFSHQNFRKLHDFWLSVWQTASSSTSDIDYFTETESFKTYFFWFLYEYLIFWPQLSMATTILTTTVPTTRRCGVAKKLFFLHDVEKKTRVKSFLFTNIRVKE